MACCVGGVFGHFKTDRVMALGSTVEDFVQPNLLDNTGQVGGVGEFSVAQNKVLVADMRGTGGRFEPY